MGVNLSVSKIFFHTNNILNRSVGHNFMPCLLIKGLLGIITIITLFLKRELYLSTKISLISFFFTTQVYQEFNINPNLVKLHQITT